MDEKEEKELRSLSDINGLIDTLNPSTTNIEMHMASNNNISASQQPLGASTEEIQHVNSGVGVLNFSEEAKQAWYDPTDTTSLLALIKKRQENVRPQSETYRRQFLHKSSLHLNSILLDMTNGLFRHNRMFICVEWTPFRLFHRNLRPLLLTLLYLFFSIISLTITDLTILLALFFITLGVAFVILVFELQWCKHHNDVYRNAPTIYACIANFLVNKNSQNKKYASFTHLLLNIDLSRHRWIKADANTAQSTSAADVSMITLPVVPRAFGWFLVAGSVFVSSVIAWADLVVDIKNNDLFDNNESWFFKCTSVVWNLDEDSVDMDVVNDGTCLIRHSILSLFFIHFVYFGFLSVALLRYPRNNATLIQKKYKYMIANKYYDQSKLNDGYTKMSVIDDKISKIIGHELDRDEDSGKKDDDIDMTPLYTFWQMNWCKLILSPNAKKCKSCYHVLRYYVNKFIIAALISFAALYINEDGTNIFWHVVNNPSPSGKHALAIFFVTRAGMIFYVVNILADLRKLYYWFLYDFIAMYFLECSIYVTCVQDKCQLHTCFMRLFLRLFCWVISHKNNKKINNIMFTYPVLVRYKKLLQELCIKIRKCWYCILAIICDYVVWNRWSDIFMDWYCC